ncbi:DUF4159 domain-containing protein [Tropicimonas isoalkanivorans]|uniref:N-terminal double-transmembrane domain-containing protein n=1 Tax=Tropicimonas isoalkanivorans TaxID=441112 RepID=A0A1I1IK75_9RHOB|nr:DUF4159 domain-containing protein [Tropicimonas isoalkanivorans]SFC36694.1 N-terminal double-transmembrane domain-containing protein [Tropicimonas isoalkanivorans]
MWMLGPIGFTAPLLLLGLLALPILWILLRAVPPAPIRRRFPGVALLLGLADDETQTDRTPWWLLLIRMLAAAAIIIGFAGPVLNPQVEDTGSGPLLVVVDGTWADAPDWARRQDRIAVLMEEAGRAGRTVALIQRTELPAGPLEFLSADRVATEVAGIEPNPWEPDPEAQAAWIEGLGDARFDTVWLSDGLERETRAPMLEALEARGRVRVIEGGRPVQALAPVLYEDGEVLLNVRRAVTAGDAELTLDAIGRDPAGTERVLARTEMTIPAGADGAETALSLPPELRNRITRFQIAGLRSAAAVSLTDDSLKRREVALIAGRDDREGLELLSPVHYLRQALAPTADLLDGGLMDILPANPDAIVLADVARLAPLEQDALLEWIDEGGLLVRFAGPRLAASDVSRDELDPLMPVRLREGGRSIGGAMSWGEPRTLRPFTEGSPFFGLTIPDEVTVSSQVMAQPDPALGERVIAALADGTPLVTRRPIGAGQVVLFHVTANAEWSTLPLSGLFVEMLERLAVSTRPSMPTIDDLTGTTWSADHVLDGFGDLHDAETLPGVSGERLAERRFGREMPPGLYTDGERSLALNVLAEDDALVPASWPARIPVEGMSIVRETRLAGPILAVALMLLALDLLASLWLSGRLRGGRGVFAGMLALALLLPSAPPAMAQDADAEGADDALAIAATGEVVLAHVITGDPQLDKLADAGLRGLSEGLFNRTSVEPAEPMAVNLETDELAFFPFLYWPVSENQPIPTAEAYARLNRYLRSGGMILFDTRDADIGGYGGSTPTGRKLQQLAAPLDIPPLEPIPQDHVLTRTFYLLQDFPGRYASRDVWVESAPEDAELADGMPFRNLNDNVTPVVIGGNDWASAWAVDRSGAPLYPVGRGFAGERQRELALRFGVNLIMHVLTGNYKSDQVHVPALLDRLGQ